VIIIRVKVFSKLSVLKKIFNLYYIVITVSLPKLPRLGMFYSLSDLTECLINYFDLGLLAIS